MREGKIFEREILVTSDMLASKVGSGMVDVFATPCMISEMEKTASMCVADELEEGFVTVGTHINVSHISATPVNMRVKIVATITNVTDRIISFDVSAFDEVGKIGEGTHSRAIVNKCKFELKTNKKGQSDL